VEVSAKLVERVPPGNLRVPLAEFAAVWVVAEQRNREPRESGVLDWYAGGVTVTCRWLAGAIVQDATGRYPAPAPVSLHEHRAYEELIEAEYLAAELLGVRWPELAVRRPGWCEGIRATLRWGWRRTGPPPLPLPSPVPAVPADG
jgi:hypothetical protein